MGFRFRLHVQKLPGNPDIVLPKHRKIIFVHGCFWHSHQGCARSKRPATNVDFWNKKISGNIRRDKNNLAELSELGWKTLVIWECETRKPDQLVEKLTKFLSPGG
jgi:DNA mismatch endonuclease (patch repair protein)